MTRTERRQKSLAAILDAALAEFGERGYASAAATPFFFKNSRTA